MATRALRLYPYQEQGVAWLAPRRTGALLDEMGLGKTLQALRALPVGAPVVVACPSGVKWNWTHEIRRARPDYAVRVAKGMRGFRWPPPGVILVVNFEILPPAEREIARLNSRAVRASLNQETAEKAHKLASRVEKLRKIRSRLTAPFNGTVLIADEAHRLKNPETRTAIRWREMAYLAYQRRGRVWLLTGTPLVNNEGELWVVLQAAGLGTEAFGDHNSYKLAWKNPGEVAAKLRGVSLCRKRADVLPHLPPKTREVRVVPIGADLVADLDQIVAALRRRGVPLQTATLEQIRLAAQSVELRDHVMRTRERLAVAKVPAMLDLVAECEESGVPLVVFAAHRRPLDMLERRRGWTAIHGGHSAEKKRENEQRFQTGAARGIAVGYRAGGLGINLFRAWRAVHVDLPWTPAELSQAEDRLCRIGQRAAGLQYTRLVADHPLERRVERLLAAKQEKIDASVTLSAVTPGDAAR